MDLIHNLVAQINNFVWGVPMLVLILGTGFYLMIGLKGMPILRLGLGFRLVWQGRTKDDKTIGQVSSFQALMTCLSATVGTGNIAGVATAIFLGGPGALFWMWCTALVGMATKYSEVVLAVHYRDVDDRGECSGGPMYAIKNGLSHSWHWLGFVFALFGGLAGFGIGNMVQSNSMAEVIRVTFGVETWITGLITTLVVAMVVLGGIKRIAKVAASLVPFMCIAYILMSVIVLVLYASRIPEALSLIFTHAFTPAAASGGFAGAAVLMAIQYGVARGIFSNEAGLGTAGIAQAAAVTNSPVRSGLIGMTGTFIDTIVICTLTGLVIVCTGVWDGGASGASLSSLAFESALPGVGAYLLASALVVFTFTTILGWSYYGERCWIYLAGKKSVMPFRIIWVFAVFGGAVFHLDFVWLLADTLNALMAIPNLISLWLLSPVVLKLTLDYFSQQKIS
ncbi:alanine/glycine:cation symporter family protein [Cellvibrio fontiphilus]|uniref:Alanine/glycine:cation symporter family protein n=1 Tax=Cellvibrio fontiphilus TaxID=1815559 RepID=A0ABV7FGM7_9GAMM